MPVRGGLQVRLADLDQGGHARGIVVGAVVDAVALVGRQAETEVVEVRAQDDVLAPEPWAAPTFPFIPLRQANVRAGTKKAGAVSSTRFLEMNSVA